MRNWRASDTCEAAWHSCPHHCKTDVTFPSGDNNDASVNAQNETMTETGTAHRQRRRHGKFWNLWLTTRAEIWFPQMTCPSWDQWLTHGGNTLEKKIAMVQAKIKKWQGKTCFEWVFHLCKQAKMLHEAKTPNHVARQHFPLLAHFNFQLHPLVLLHSENSFHFCNSTSVQSIDCLSVQQKTDSHLLAMCPQPQLLCKERGNLLLEWCVICQDTNDVKGRMITRGMDNHVWASLATALPDSFLKHLSWLGLNAARTQLFPMWQVSTAWDVFSQHKQLLFSFNDVFSPTQANAFQFQWPGMANFPIILIFEHRCFCDGMFVIFLQETGFFHQMSEKNAEWCCCKKTWILAFCEFTPAEQAGEASQHLALASGSTCAAQGLTTCFTRLLGASECLGLHKCKNWLAWGTHYFFQTQPLTLCHCDCWFASQSTMFSSSNAKNPACVLHLTLCSTSECNFLCCHKLHSKIFQRLDQCCEVTNVGKENMIKIWIRFLFMVAHICGHKWRLRPWTLHIYTDCPAAYYNLNFFNNTLWNEK